MDHSFVAVNPDERVPMHETHVTYDREKMQNKSDLYCAIYLANFEDGDNCAAVERCQHMYHEECIETWLKQWNLHCPCCRASIPLECRLILVSNQ
ncbi:hypothetical protein SLA2020_172830 [Shorea laevis]